MSEKSSVFRPLSWVAETIGVAADKVFEGPTLPKEQNLDLPYGVLEELRFSESGEIGKRSLEALLRKEWYDQCVYLWVKSLDADPERQKQLLLDITVAEQFGEDVGMLRQVLDVALEEMPEETTVQATKIVQVSRQGNHTWADKFLDKAKQYQQEQTQPFLVAYASLQGLRYFNRVAQKQFGHTHILVPNWIADGGEHCGYDISFGGETPSVSFLPRDFVRPVDAVIFDETINTGNGMKKMEEFWMQQNSTPPRIDSVVNLSHISSKK
jgi:hypothetical protein